MIRGDHTRGGRVVRLAIALASTVAALALSPLDALAAGEEEEGEVCDPSEPAEPREFVQPLLVPGAVWTYQVSFDTDPEMIGESAVGTFELVDMDADSIGVAFHLVTPAFEEGQLLRAYPFQDQLRTFEVSNTGSSVVLSFPTGLVHFDYPLVVGKQWGEVIPYDGTFGPISLSNMLDYELSVVGQECIATPAGTFVASIVENAMGLGGLGQELLARLWVSDDGLLVKRQSLVNGVLEREIVLVDADVPAAATQAEASIETSLLEQRAAESLPIGLRILTSHRLGVVDAALAGDLSCSDAAGSGPLARAERTMHRIVRSFEHFGVEEELIVAARVVAEHLELIERRLCF